MQYIQKYELDWVIKRLNTEPANWKNEYEAAMLSIIQRASTAAYQDYLKTPVVLNHNHAGMVRIDYNKSDRYVNYNLVVVSASFWLTIPNSLVNAVCKESTVGVLTEALLGSPVSNFTDEEPKVFILPNEIDQKLYGWRGDNYFSFLNSISFKRVNVKAPASLTACRHYF